MNYTLCTFYLLATLSFSTQAYETSLSDEGQKNPIENALTATDIFEISGFYNANVDDAMTQTWQDTGIDKWRQALQAMFCSKNIVELNRFSIMFDSWPIFMANIGAEQPQTKFPDRLTSAQIYIDTGNAFFRSYTNAYALGALNTHVYMEKEHPEVLDTLCTKLDLSDAKLEASVMENTYEYNKGVDLSKLDKSVRFQHDLLEHLGRTATLVLVRSSKPRWTYLTTAGIFRHFSNHESFKEVEAIYLETQPVIGVGGYVDHLSRLYQEFNGSVIEFNEQNWKLINHVWDAQRRAYYRGVSSTLSHIRRNHPDLYKEIEAKTVEMINMLNGPVNRAL